MLERVFAAFRELPGASGVATIDRLPLGGRGSTAALQVAGRPSDGDTPMVLVRTVSPTYFETMGVPVRGGRVFSDRDREGTPPVVVVNQMLAAQIFGGAQAIGERVVFDFLPGKPQWEIVGVVGDEQFEELDRQRSPVAYFPYGQNPSGNFSLVIRADAPRSIAAVARQTVAQLDRQLLVPGMATMEEIARQSTAMFFRRAVLALLGVFALAALMLAAVGVYGTLAYVVSQRTREIGIRLALGARRQEVVRLMLRHGMMPAVIGSVLGVAGSFAFSGFLKSLLFGVQPNDAMTLVASVAFLCTVAFVACLIPMLRAAHVDPAITLRQD